MDEPKIQGTEDSYTSEYEVGQDNIEAFGLDLDDADFIGRELEDVDPDELVSRLERRFEDDVLPVVVDARSRRRRHRDERCARFDRSRAMDASSRERPRVRTRMNE